MKDQTEGGFEPMEDDRIIALYNERNELAIVETSQKYGQYCGSIAVNILCDSQAAEECVNDTWLSAWNAIPPAYPKRLRVFLGRITRNLAFDRYRKSRADKRGGGQTDLILTELEECVSSNGSVDSEIDRKELGKAISDFLRKQPEMRRNAFIRRYWYCDSVGEIARRCGIKQGNAAVMLGRMREALKIYLTERGFEI